jgi:hypothetical protein
MDRITWTDKLAFVLHMQLAYMHTPLQRQFLRMCLDAMQF